MNYLEYTMPVLAKALSLGEIRAIEVAFADDGQTVLRIACEDAPYKRVESKKPAAKKPEKKVVKPAKTVAEKAVGALRNWWNKPRGEAPWDRKMDRF